VHPFGDPSSDPYLWALRATNRGRLYACRHGSLRSAAFWAIALLYEVSRSISGNRERHGATVRALLKLPAQGRSWPTPSESFGSSESVLIDPFEARIRRLALYWGPKLVTKCPGASFLRDGPLARTRVRSILFHHVTDETSPFVDGLRTNIRVDVFASALESLGKRYEFVDLDWVLHGDRRELRRPPLLLTFDDAYRSVARTCAPMLKSLEIPAVYFVNAGVLDDRTIALDNLVTYVVNTRGTEALCRAAGVRTEGLDHFIREHLPKMGIAARRGLHLRLCEAVGQGPSDLAAQSGLYLQSGDLPELVQNGFEIGNHTYSHVHCRSLSTDELRSEIETNKSTLEAISGRPVRAFSFPYGSRLDATEHALAALRASGHSIAFLVQALPNPRRRRSEIYHRVSLRTGSDQEIFAELEVLPRVRALKARLR
jgi:peptidoglycan/xylan/chitin deacetylase (PgdA/CDA1 family)